MKRIGSIYDSINRMNEYAKIHDDPNKYRNDRIDRLVSEFENDPDLLNEVLMRLRKDKIDKIKNR